MNTGMMWFDNDKHTPLSTKVGQAAEYYRRKYGRHPDICQVHPTMFTGSEQQESHIGRVTLRPNQIILPGHLWIGVDDLS